MTTAATLPAREIPAHRVANFSPRRHKYALVIPVINEGERIRDQLKKLAAFAFPIDVILADGNSSDGSTDPAFLQQVGVRALLVKTAPGKLSAQLRMAYAWCLDEGYAGVVTVDGNGKDGLDAVPRFIERLNEGYDYVQGSRYLPGGGEVNTPASRYLAGRFIHAPLVSLAAGQRFTDTTNGFRAYSARALEDPRVQPFRAIFDVYNLLFYLSIRIPQLGLRAIEIPVVRAYPKTGKTPTKIAGMRGKLALLAELVAAARGKYNP